MTVGEMDVIELLAVIVTAIVYSGLWLLGLREVTQSKEPRRAKFVATFGLIAGICLPLFITFNMFSD